MASEKTTNKISDTNNVLVAGVVYLLMNKSYHISRNVRAQWFLQHLNTTITVHPSKNVGDSDCELAVVSILPRDCPEEWNVDNRHLYHYLVTTSTNVIFFSEIYSTVYCLDMSPSISAVDIQHGKVMLDEIVDVLDESLSGVVSRLIIPGSDIIFEPQIFVTVIVHTPFFTTPAQQVLVQGWQVTQENLAEFLAAIRKQLQLLEDTIADVSALAYDQLEALRIRQMESDRLVGGLFEESSERVQMSTAEIPMVSPDSGFINLLRYGMLALRLLPHSSLSNLVVVTDGVISLPDIHVLDLVLTQLRTNAVAVSFLHVGSQFHPHCAQGLVPYSELMQFISCATFGTYIPHCSFQNYGHEGLNTYHEAFLTWSFKKGANVHELSTPVPRMGEWFVSNHSFYGNREPQLLMKKQTEDNLNASLASVLCCRLHEGFMIKNISVKESQLEVCLMLPWANHIYIEYIVLCEWPVLPQNSVRFYISIKAPYEFLHDITCLIKKQFQSPYRQAVVTRFWTTVKTLAQSDLLLAHLDSFSLTPLSFALPETIRSGMPLFYLPSSSGPHQLSSSDPSCPQFAHFWRPVCLLDPSVWHKWMHTQTLSLVLQHDLPLPRFLHVASPNGRFQGLQCRHAAATLYNFLKDWTSFVLIENHSYLKFLSSGDSDKSPSWFYVVRVQQKPPCAVLHIAFLGGTPGKLRHQIIEQLKMKISALTIPQRLTTKHQETTFRNQGEAFVDNQTRSNVPCCILLNKPLEKILIRYERMPSEFGTVVFPDGTQPQTAVKPPRPTSTLVTTLSRYLHHRRWVWSVSPSSHHILHVSNILSLLTQMRLQEGFRFAHSTAGIINMVLEIQMKCCDQEADHMCDNYQPCIIQYVLFPLHVTSNIGKGSTSEEEDTEVSESDSSLELIAECWIEPQHGLVARGSARRSYMENLPYHQLADVMWRMDAECITKLLTFEQLRLMSQNPQIPVPPRMDPLEAPPRNPLENWPHATALSDQRIQKIPFAYNVISILPESQQVELQFPMFIQDLGDECCAKTQTYADSPNVLLMETFFQQLKDLHDKELFLTPMESKQLVEMICKRQRNLEKHPVPFPRRHSCDSSSKSSGRKFSDKDSREEDKESEWPKIHCNDGLEKVNCSNLPIHPTPCTKSKPRKSCGPLYRMYPQTPPNRTPPHMDVDRDVPRWRFFVKRSSQTYITLTFVPASYRDCKALMLSGEPKAWILQPESDSSSSVIPEQNLQLELAEEEKQCFPGSKLDPEAKPFVPMILQKDSSPSVSNYSPLSNKGWVEYKLDSTWNVSDNEASQTDLQQSTWGEPSSSPFRLRARSWEPIKPQSVLKTKKHSSPRVRTRSVGSKYNEYKMRRKLNYDHDTFKPMISNLPSNPPSNPVLGHINVPVYVYGCSLDNLMDSLILKTEYKRDFKDLFCRKTCKTDVEGEFESDDNSDTIDHCSSQDSSDDLTITREECEVKHHAQTISQAFTKSFGVSLFKALHLGHNINAANVQTAMEECEEALVEINITQYLQTVCRHLKEVKDRMKEGDQESLVDLESFRSATSCVEYRHLHNLIKNKFHHIITSCFKPVPTNQEYYFCSPNWERDHQVDLNTMVNANLEDRRNLETTHDFDSNQYQAEFIEFRSDQGSNVGGASPWETVGSVTTPDEAHTSLLSNRDSDSLSIFPEEESDEDISPLFLHLICTVQSEGQMGNCSVQILPTCLEELVDYLDGSFTSGMIDLKSLTVSLDILCLTLPQQSKMLHSSPNTTGSHDEQFPVVSSTLDNLRHLPEYQHKAVSLCVEEIKWLMRDEIAAFLLDQSPITEATLQLVADHITSSPGRASCVCQTVPLQFVFGAEQSLTVFLQDFSMMRVPGYCLKKENELYYVVKDPNHRGSQDSQHSSELWIPGGGDMTPNKNEPGVEVENKSTGWSSVAAWHVEVANLMEGENLICEGSMSGGGDGVVDEYSDWLRELESRRSELPNFWLIMRVDKDAVTCFFHCRFLELETPEVKLYSLVQKNIVNSIKKVCKTVNQKMLLNNLHDTRMCNQLLEPESMEDIWRSSHSSAQMPKPDEDTGASEVETPVDYLEASLKFLPGWFSCPVVWETYFTLHPRLKTGPTKPGLSRGIQALRTVLNRFCVNNRKNMFVYQDHHGNVFYLRLYENVKTITRTVDGEDNSPLSVSRSSSINSLNNTGAKKTDDTGSSTISAVSKELRPRLKSFGEVVDNIRQEEFLTLKVHGISEAGAEVKSELVQVLHNRLDDAVLEVLSVMLARNPMCKLSPEDVHFIQKPHHKPESTVQFSLPTEALDNLQAVFHYLRQNLMQFMHTPKYTDTRPQFHLQDYSHPEEPSKQVPEGCMFLYNQSPASGNKGIACVAVALVESGGNIVEQMSYQPPSITAFLDKPFTASQFTSLTTTNASDGDSGASVRVEFRIWKQGRVNVESLTLKLKNAVRHALWDLVTELRLLTAPLSSTVPFPLDLGGDESPLNTVYQSIIAPWMQFGYKLGTPAVSTHIVALSQRHPVNITLSEIANLVSFDGTSGFVYYQKDAAYLPYKLNNSHSLQSTTTCLLIARNHDQWRASIKAEPRLCLDKLEPKSQKVLQKFSPFVMAAAGEIMLFVPRQRFLIAIVNNEKIILHTYNWAKDLVELLVKQIGLLGQWLTARSNLQIGVTCQKMGLFLNQPVSRKSDPQVANNPFMSQIGDVESLMTFRPGGGRGSGSSGGMTVSAAQLQEVLRDTRPAPLRQQTSDPVVASIQQLFDTRAQDRRGHQKKLYTMWQMRGGTPNIPIAEDVLQVFMLYSRVIHYCVTPLLFLPRWRIQSASTRDSSLKSHKSISQSSLQDSSQMSEEKWHQNLCANFVSEYKQYLQSLGFIPVQLVPFSPKKGFRSTKTIVKDENTVCYLQKSLLGGILLFELCLCEPFFYSKLHALECSRLEGKASSGLISQFTLSFLDECDKVKVLMHLHSFTYDFHLRTLTKFVCGGETPLRPGYHVTGFLDDFLKYYSKAPNYAYSLAHSGNLVIPKMSTPANLLFNYLLSHKENYPMKVIRMVPSGQELDDNLLSSSNEYVLVQQSSSTQVMYRDIQDNKQVYEYDIVLVVANEESSEPTILKLCYYILLTSRREPYAKLEDEKKLGKFCTVSTANPLTLYTISRETTPPIPEETPEELAESHQNYGKHIYERRSSSNNVEIKAESVNYVGYYSSHEQFMQQVILEQAVKARGTIEEMITQVSLHCRTHFLWNKLTTASSTGMSPTYAEFSELLSLGSIEAVSDIDPRVSPVLAQPMAWYQGLLKVLQAKYADNCRFFTSPDGVLQYLLVLHPRVPLGFLMITIDSNAAGGEVNIVTSKTLGNEQISNAHLPNLVEDVINACCFQLWTGLL